MNFFHLIFPCANIFFVLRLRPPPPHKFSNGPSLNIVCDKRTVFLVLRLSTTAIYLLFFISDEATSYLLNNVTSACVRINLVGSKDPFWTKASLKCYLGDRSQHAALLTDTSSCMFSSYVKRTRSYKWYSIK